VTLVLLSFLGGVLTILSPCILPVLPFVFARAEQPFLKSGLPLLAGMAVSFAGVATLAAVGGAWAVRVNQYGRVFALVLLAAFAATLLSRRLADLLARPFISLGNRLSQTGAGEASKAGLWNSMLLGVATGLLWAPCAGPILGLVLTGAALSGPNAHTTLLLFAYAAGAAVSLAVAMLAGARLFKLMKKSLGAGEWIRRGLGIAVLLGVVAIALGWDSGVLTRLSYASTSGIEQSLVRTISPGSGASGGNSPDANAIRGNTATSETASEGNFPSLEGALLWLNSPPLTPESLRGKVVVVDFWTYSCINCLRSLPYVKAWYERYKDHGLVVIGVHAPEFAFEKNAANVRRAVMDLGITYPVALDNSYAIWQRFNNQFWPAHYFIDAMGRVRGHHFGEGDYDGSERTIRQLLVEAGRTDLPPAVSGQLHGSGIEAAADQSHVQSPETYIGYARAQHFSSPDGIVADQAKSYTAPAKLELNQWALEGSWRIAKDQAALTGSTGSISFRFLARDVHLVLGPAADGKPVRFRLELDGRAPGADHGVDVNADGTGTVTEERLYQLIRQSQQVGEHTVTITFIDSGVHAYSFTFG
jgi:cytochrome c biogenesis protein CcdA/thiol-disulfide isomerase/thioredoxin